MINLGRCLAYLMERHDCVALTGIGTFRRTRNNAYYDEDSQTYFPALTEVNFVADGGTGEGAEHIVDYIVAQRNFNRSSAQALYRKSLGDLLKQLNEGGSAVLDGFGRFIQHGEDLQFEELQPSMDAEDLEPRMDLPHRIPAVQTPPIDFASGADHDYSGSLHINSEKFEEAILEEPFEQEESLPTKDVPDTEVPSSSFGFWKIVGILVMCLGFLTALSSVLRPDLIHDLRLYLSRQAHQVGALLSEGQSTSIPKSTETPTLAAKNMLDTGAISEKIHTLDADSTDSSATEEEAPLSAASEVQANETDRGNYQIIVASFTTMEQAEAFVAEMSKKGIKLRANQSKQPRNRKKVSYGAYATQEEAYKDLPYVQKNIEPTAWVDKVLR